MTLKAALREAYTSGDTEAVIVEAVTVDHASLDAPIYLLRNVDSALGDPGDTVSVPLEEGGPKVPHLLCGFTVVGPGADRDGPTDGKLLIDNASDHLHALMESVIGYNEPIRVSFRVYRVLPGAGGLAALTGPDDDTLTGLEMLTVDISADQAEGVLAWPDGRQINVPTGPRAFFNRDEYPGLFTS